jgi:hypothetical protein
LINSCEQNYDQFKERVYMCARELHGIYYNSEAFFSYEPSLSIESNFGNTDLSYSVAGEGNSA